MREPDESLAERKRRARTVCRRLKRTYPDAECALLHRNAFELLAATILSAQCTDERVNLTTPALFEAYPTPADLAAAEQVDVERLVQSCGFYRNKAKNLIGMARGLVEKHGGEVPRDLADLVALPGVGRKTANVVLGTAFGIASGVVVDTHVGRISRRLGLTDNTDAVAAERDLIAAVPKTQRVMYSHRLIWHGRAVCKARKADCPVCVLESLCPRHGVDDRSSPRRSRKA
ncbi:MAG: endonuclease III [Planctomycetota bacterium]